MKKVGAFVIAAALAVFYAAATVWKNPQGGVDKESFFDFYSNQQGQNLEQDTDHEDDWEPLVGYWKGTLGVPPSLELRLIFRVSPVFGQVFTYSLDQGGQFIPATATRFNPDTNEIHFFFDTIDGVYIGKLDDATRNKMTGTWKQHGRSMSLDYDRYDPPNKEMSVPREIQFAAEKVLTGDPETIVGMEGYWHGYLDDDDCDGDAPCPPLLVVIQMEKLDGNVVEPKLFLPDQSRLPVPIRSFLIDVEGNVKIVHDGSDSIFQGTLDEKTMTGTVKYDNTDAASALTLVWSKDYPKHVLAEQSTKETVN